MTIVRQLSKLLMLLEDGTPEMEPQINSHRRIDVVTT